jgi:nitroreductase
MNDDSHPFYNRYGRTDITLPSAPVNSFTQKLLQRTSCRKFLPATVPEGTLELLIAAAQSAPTSGLLQTWSVIALNANDKEKLLLPDSNKAIIGGIDTHNFSAITTSQIFLIWLADLNRINFILQNVPSEPETKMQVNRAEYNIKAMVDASIAAQTLFITAETMGLAGTYMGAIRQLPSKFLRDTFNLPVYTFPLFGMALGYPDTAFQATQLKGQGNNKPRARLNQELVLHHSTYKPMSSLDELNDYNKVHEMISRHNVFSFEDRVVERLNPTDSKRQISPFLRQMGFNFD